MKKTTKRKGKEADVHMVDKALKGPRGATSTYTALNAWPYQQQVQPAQALYRAFNQRGRPDPP